MLEVAGVFGSRVVQGSLALGTVVLCKRSAIAVHKDRDKSSTHQDQDCLPNGAVLWSSFQVYGVRWVSYGNETVW